LTLMAVDTRHPLLYVLHSSHLFGTERMALATVQGLADEFRPILFGPPGEAMDLAEKMGYGVRRFRGAKQFAKVLRPELKENRSLTFVATGVVQSGVCIALNLLYRRKINHIHIVHGGADEHGSYGRKKALNHVNVTFVTVSEFAKERMIANGVRQDRIEVVTNFLPAEYLAGTPRRGKYWGGIRKVLIVSRLDQMKRVDLLLDALDRRADELRDLSFKILGLGTEMKSLIERAARHPNVHFAGFSGRVAEELAASDLLLHTCPVEPFGLAILEAMAANVAVLAPDQGGAAMLVEEGKSGFKFRANDAENLAERLIELKGDQEKNLNLVVEGGRVAVEETFSARVGLERYRKLFAPKS
jgi:glycosyltransferase involved in cell wall biosynthesis